MSHAVDAYTCIYSRSSIHLEYNMTNIFLQKSCRNISRMKRGFMVRQTAIFVIFKRLSVTRNCLRPECVFDIIVKDGYCNVTPVDI